MFLDVENEHGVRSGMVDWVVIMSVIVSVAVEKEKRREVRGQLNTKTFGHEKSPSMMVIAFPR